MFLYVLFCCVGVVHCYGNGLVSVVCDSMTPIHRSYSAQSTTAPFSITTDKTTFKEGDQITVLLSSQSGDQFEGFMLQARRVGSSTPIGTFTVTSNAQLLSCNGVANSAVSHTSNSKKSSVDAKWTAPTSGQLGDIKFGATFLKSFSTFWVGVKSSTVAYNGTGTSSATPTVANNGTGTSSATPTVANNGTGTSATPTVAYNVTGNYSATPNTLTVSSNPNCGKTKVCFSQPSNCDPAANTGCYFMAVQTTSIQSEMRIEMFGQASGYLAIGFSDDQEMGNDDIYICGKDSSGNLQVQHAFSTGKTAPTILSLVNVTDIKTVLMNGNINCSFTSRNAISTGSRATSASEYYLMIAAGPSASQGNIQIHTSRYVSSTKANLQVPSQVITDAEEFPAIVKAHGCLMLISWMTTGSIGMLIARYLKGVAKDHGCCGKDFWFMAHVFLMVLSVIATAIAFILVFAYEKDWSGGAHPVLGCLVMILSLIQPIVAAFRCEPQHEQRFVFSWAHSFIALAIKGLAVAAIFTGLALFEEYVEDGWMLKVMGGFVTWEALMYILQDLNLRAKKKDSEICNFGSTKPETVLLILFILGNLPFLIALLVGIGRT
ncbi:putative ferric-chelate reductase 1 isoform X1 [Carassius auratus]|uniref:Ferric-chelate reductase 1 isoform X1 n=1 Tax=Carassius auratus TaxID=7957 RepID=A0A6P6P2D3_CARAU|nr:putative ferric-chelate reductase 1 isoform X1 [Carassius auratus]